MSWAGAGGPPRPGPSFFHMMGRGPARPFNFSEDGPRPGPAHHIFKSHGPAGPGTSIFQFSRPGLARPMTLAVRSMRHGLYTGRPMCCPVLKGARKCADLFFSYYFWYLFFVYVFLRDSVDQLLTAHEVHIPHYPHNSSPLTARSDGFRPEW